LSLLKKKKRIYTNTVIFKQIVSQKILSANKQNTQHRAATLLITFVGVDRPTQLCAGESAFWRFQSLC